MTESSFRWAAEIASSLPVYWSAGEGAQSIGEKRLILAHTILMRGIRVAASENPVRIGP
jgi:hypothetical protein